jgi:hypothetical protein
MAACGLVNGDLLARADRFDRLLGLSGLAQAHPEVKHICLAGGLLSILWFESLKMFKQKW